MKVQLQQRANPGSDADAGRTDLWSPLRGALAFAHRIEQEQQSTGRKQRLSISADGSAAGPLPADFDDSDRGAALQDIVERVQTLMDASGAAIAQAVSGDLVCIARSGATAPSLGVSQNRGCAVDCIQTGEPLLCSDVQGDAWVDREACRQLGIRSLVLVPVSDGLQVVGILAVFSERPGHFDRSDVDALRWVARELLPLLAASDKAQRDPPHRLSDAAPAEEAAEDTATATMATAARRGGNTKWWALLSFTVLALVVGWYLGAGKGPRNAEFGPQGNSGLSVAMPETVGPAVAGLEVDQSQAAAGGKESARRPKTGNRGLNIRTTSDAGSTIVVIEAEGLVSYETQTLENPDRIYLDLKGVVPAPASRANILPSAADSRLLRIRTGRSGDVTRVVLDLKEPVIPAISRRQNPERLIIELRSAARTGSAVGVGDRL